MTGSCICMTLVSCTLVNYLGLFLTNLVNHRNQTISVFFIFHSCISIWNFVLMSALIHACPWNVLLFEGWYVPMHNEQFHHEQQITGDKTHFFQNCLVYRNHHTYCHKLFQVHHYTSYQYVDPHNYCPQVSHVTWVWKKHKIYFEAIRP